MFLSLLFIATDLTRTLEEDLLFYLITLIVTIRRDSTIKYIRAQRYNLCLFCCSCSE